MLSILEESEPVVLTMGCSSSTLGSKGVANLVLRARDHARLPSMVLISPLCAKKRKGYAKGQRGAVLVERGWW